MKAASPTDSDLASTAAVSREVDASKWFDLPSSPRVYVGRDMGDRSSVMMIVWRYFKDTSSMFANLTEFKFDLFEHFFDQPTYELQ